MDNSLVNLNTIWDVAKENSDVFNQRDLFEILTAHLGYSTANALRRTNTYVRPCYAFIPCEECNYVKFCLVKQGTLNVRSTKECQQNLKKFMSSFP